MVANRRRDMLTRSAIQMLELLVGFDSVSRHSNLPLIALIEAYLDECGISSARIPSPDGRKTNLLARIGPKAAGGVVLSGHTDVVPVDGQDWASDPFKLTKRRGKFYGRGTADMKSFISACLALAPEWVKRPLRKPIWLAFSYDEEVGCLGAPLLLDYIVRHIPKPAFAVIGEPTMMEVVTAHKGVLSFRTTVRGLEAHSSQPQHGVNAVHIACELVHFLTVMGTDLARSGRHSDRFNPPYSTVHVGTIEGGTARNIIARECSFQWEIRPLPAENIDGLLKRFQSRCNDLLITMRKTYPQADIETEPMSHMGGVTLPASAQRYAQAVMRAARTNREIAVSFGTEAGVFNEHGIPAIVCGPGSIEQAHKPNEFIEPSQIQECITFLKRLMEETVGA